MKDPKVYTPKDRAAVAGISLYLQAFLTQVVPPTPSDPLVKNRAWRRYEGVHFFDPWEYTIEPTLAAPFIKAAVALEDLSMAFRETLTMNPLTHDCRYLTRIQNHEHLMIVIPQRPDVKSDPNDPDISVVAFSDNPHLFFADHTFARRAAARCFAYLLFRAREMDLVEQSFLTRLDDIAKRCKA